MVNGTSFTSCAEHQFTLVEVDGVFGRVTAAVLVHERQNVRHPDLGASTEKISDSGSVGRSSRIRFAMGTVEE
jgi:hypothetical protein